MIDPKLKQYWSGDEQIFTARKKFIIEKSSINKIPSGFYFEYPEIYIVDHLKMLSNVSSEIIQLVNIHAKQVLLSDNKFDGLAIEQFYGGLSLGGERYTGDHGPIITARNCNFNYLDLYDISSLPTDSALGITILDSRINRFKIKDLKNKDGDIHFIRDTLTGSFTAFAALNKPKILSLRFENSYINSQFDVNDVGFRLYFENCVFGPDASFDNIGAGEIAFNNCIFTAPVRLNRRRFYGDMALNKITYIIVSGTDLKYLDFNLSEDLVVVLPDKKYPRPENDIRLYNNLRDKFRSEGKEESYQHVDVKFQEYKYGNTIFGRMLNALDRTWWYYGYQQYRILWITLILFAVIAIVNFAFWRIVTRNYQVVKFEALTNKSSKSKKFRFWVNRLLRVMVFTSLIFLSLRIDFEKLSFSSSWWLLWFFFQYCSGLVCLYFILKYMLNG